MFNDDVGEYTCRASNIHGEATTSAQVGEPTDRYVFLLHGRCFQLLIREQYERWFAEEQSRLTRDRRQAQVRNFVGRKVVEERISEATWEPRIPIREGGGGAIFAEILRTSRIL